MCLLWNYHNWFNLLFSLKNKQRLRVFLFSEPILLKLYFDRRRQTSPYTPTPPPTHTHREWGGGWLLTTKNPASSPSSPVLPSSVLRHILLVCHRHLLNNLFHFHLRLIFCCHISRRRIFQDLTCDVIFRNYDVIVPKCFLINITSTVSNFRKVMHSYHQSNSSGKNSSFSTTGWINVYKRPNFFYVWFCNGSFFYDNNMFSLKIILSWISFLSKF